MTVSSQLLDGVTMATAENNREGSEFFGKVDASKVAVMGQSCGGGQAVDVSLDPRVTTTVVLNQGVNMVPRTPGSGGPPRRTPAPDRYAQFAPALIVAPSDAAPGAAASANRAEILGKLHAPILFLNGGPSDSGFANVKANFEAINHVPVVLAYQEVGHYPATYRQPNGGAFAKAVGVWLKWHLKGDSAAKGMFAVTLADCVRTPPGRFSNRILDSLSAL